jgi:UDP-N-acetylglucosamine:LPS N-acetylglucosamine transferase
MRMRAVRKVMAVASGGGHWVELRRIMPAFEGAEVVYVSTDPRGDADLAPARYYTVRNVTRRNGLTFAVTIRQLLAIVRHERPEVVVTTGAAPGLVALVVAKLVCRSRTVWIDTVAHSERMTLSGRLAKPFADAWLVQWPHLARPGGPEFWGAVI